MNRVIAASTIVVVVALATAFSAGPGVASSGIPAGLASAIHAKLGPGALRLSNRAAGAFRPTPEFGHDVALSADGTTALVAAVGVNNYQGAAYIYHVSNAGSWSPSDTPTATLTNGAGELFDYFGGAVQLSADGTTAYIGSPGANDETGAIFVFHAASEDAWSSSSTPQATLTISRGFDFGGDFAVTPDGTTLVAGAPNYDSGAGGAYIFHASDEGTWSGFNTFYPVAVLSNLGEDPNDDEAGDYVGVSADGTTAILSDPGGNDGAGDAWIFHVADAGAWASSTSPTAILSDSNSVSDDFLGAAVALSGDGRTAFAGAPGVNNFTGAVDVFQSGEGPWISSSTPAATLSNASGAQGDAFGAVVFPSLDGATLAITAPGAFAPTPDSDGIGAGYVFHTPDSSSWASSSAPTATLTDSSGVSGDILGESLTFSGDGATALLGAPGTQNFIGKADVFHAADASSWSSASTPTATLTNAALLQAFCVVPKLKGLTLGAARDALDFAGCRSGRVTTRYSSVQAGRVVSQSPRPGTTLAFNARVSFKLSIGPWHK